MVRGPALSFTEAVGHINCLGRAGADHVGGMDARVPHIPSMSRSIYSSARAVLAPSIVLEKRLRTI